jgi:diguanylate cyclase (GGDEF)-like protein
MAFFSRAFDREKAIKQAEKYVQQGKVEAAIKEYEAVAKADPGDVTISNILGDLYQRANRVDEAAARFAHVAEFYRKNNQMPQAVATYRKLVRLAPDRPEHALTLADLSRKQGMAADARQMFQQAAEAARRINSPNTLIAALRELSKLDGNSAATKFELAEAYAATGQRNDATEAYLAAAAGFRTEGRIEQTRAAFERATELRPENLVALRGLVETMIDAGQSDAAYELIRGRISQSPNNLDLAVTLGRAYIHGGDLPSAEATFERLYSVDQARFEHKLEVAEAWIERGNYDRAIEIVRQCLDVTLARGQKKRATAVLKQIIEKSPEHIEALKCLAEIYERVDEKRNLASTLNLLAQAAIRIQREQDAIRALEKLVEHQPNKKAYRKQLEELSAQAQRPAAEAPPQQSFPEGFEAPSAVGYFDRMMSTTIGGETVTESEEKAAPKPVSPTPSESEYSVALLDSILAQNPELVQARLSLLEKMAASQPEHIDTRLQLKQLYLDAGHKDLAARECMLIANLYQAKGNGGKASELRAEALEIDPNVELIPLQSPIPSPDVLIPLEPIAFETPGLANMLTPTYVPPPQPQPVYAPPVPAAPRSRLDDLLTASQFQKFHEREWSRAARDGKPVALLLVKMDYFDAYSPSFRVPCLEIVSQLVEGALGDPGELVAFLGTDEFLVLLPETDAVRAQEVAERMRTTVLEKNIPHSASPHKVVTASIGVTSDLPLFENPQFDIMLENLEQTLLIAISNGGNQIAVSPTAFRR